MFFQGLIGTESRLKSHYYLDVPVNVDLVSAMIFQKNMEFGTDTCLAFTDIKRAYDNMNRQKVWEVL
jgi:hypothetical protein